jgi:hypothetical protein
LIIEQQAAKVGAKEGQDSKQHKPGEEAMNFLQACLEDLELERLMATQQTDAFHQGIRSPLKLSSVVWFL